MCKKHELCAQQKQNKTEKMFMGCKFELCILKGKQNRKSTLCMNGHFSIFRWTDFYSLKSHTSTPASKIAMDMALL